MKIKPRNKKGSHVGVVVSFVVFITFLIFLYAILQPSTVRERDKSYILEYVTLNLVGTSTEDINSMLVYIGDPVSKCINLQNIIAETEPAGEGEIPESMQDHLSFKGGGENFAYKRSGQGFLVDTPAGFSGIIRINMAEGLIGLIDDTLGGCNPHPYTVGYIKTFSEIFEEKMYELNETYYADYEGLKASLGIPEGTEFSFYIYNSERELIISAEMQEPPTDRSVYAEETPIQYVDENADIQFGFLVVKVW